MPESEQEMTSPRRMGAEARMEHVVEFFCSLNLYNVITTYRSLPSTQHGTKCFACTYLLFPSSNLLSEVDVIPILPAGKLRLQGSPLLNTVLGFKYGALDSKAPLLPPGTPCNSVPRWLVFERKAGWCWVWGVIG